MGPFQPLLGHGTIWTEWSVDPRVSGASEDWIRGTHVNPRAEDDHVIKKLCMVRVIVRG